METIARVNVGEHPNDGTGDKPRVAFTKINENFAALEVSAQTVHAAVEAAHLAATAAGEQVSALLNSVADLSEAQSGAGGGLLTVAGGKALLNANLASAPLSFDGQEVSIRDVIRSFNPQSNIAFWGAHPDKSAADNTPSIQACFDWCRDNDAPYYVPHGGFPVNPGLKVYTAGRMDGKLLATNAVDATQILVTVCPHPSDLTPIPVSFFNGLTMTAGMSEDVAWAPYYGCFCYWRTTSQKMLNHTNGVNYALADSIIVGQPDGKFSPAYSWTKSGTWSALQVLPAHPAGAGAWAEKLRKRIRCEINIEYASGSAGEAEGAIAVYRSNTTVVPSLTNATAFPVRQAVLVGPCANVVVEDPDVAGLDQTTTNYSVQASTAINVTVRGGQSIFGRRSIDGNNNTRGMNVVGGRWTDGVGGHLVYGTNITGGAYISADGPNSAPLFMSGGDLFVDETCTVRVPAELGSVFATRNDAFEFSGKLILRCTIELDCFTRGASTCRIVQLVANTTANFNWGREMRMPDLIEVSGIIKQFGPSYTGGIDLLYMFDTTNTYASAVRGEGKIVIKPVLKYDAGVLLADGVSPRSRIFIAKSASQWTAGGGYDLIVEDMAAVRIGLSCAASRTDNGQRVNVITRNIGTLLHSVAPGAFRKLLLSAETITNPVGYVASRDLTGRTTLVGDEVEARNDALQVSVSWTPGVIAAGGIAQNAYTIPGVKATDALSANHAAAIGSNYRVTAVYAGPNTVNMIIENRAGSPSPSLGNAVGTVRVQRS